jgi:hypothetical protein
MIGFFSSYMVLTRHTVPPAQTGTVTGTLKTNAGTPAVGVSGWRSGPAGVDYGRQIRRRLCEALLKPTLPEGSAWKMFRRGRYYINAGRCRLPTYFPGTQDVTAGRVVLVKPGDTITGIDLS